MNNKIESTGHNRRDALRLLGMGSAAGLFGMLGAAGSAKAGSPATGSATAGPLSASSALAASPGGAWSNKGLPPLKIKSVKAIATAPEGANLIVVKVETTEPGLYGLR